MLKFVLILFPPKNYANSRKCNNVGVKLEWIAKAIANPLKVETQADRSMRCWAKPEENEGRYLRVILLEDGETVIANALRVGDRLSERLT